MILEITILILVIIIAFGIYFLFRLNKMYSLEKVKNRTLNLRVEKVAGDAQKKLLEQEKIINEQSISHAEAIKNIESSYLETVNGLNRDIRDKSNDIVLLRNQLVVLSNRIYHSFHDLNNKLTPVVTYSDLIQNSVTEDSNKEDILGLCYNQKRALERLKAFAQIEKRSFQGEKISIEMITLDEILTTHFENLKISIEGDIKLMIRTNKEHAHGMIVNFLSNATRHHAQHLLIKISENGDQAHVCIFNDGIPLNEDATNKLFKERYSSLQDGTGNSYNSFSMLKSIHAGHEAYIAPEFPSGYTVGFCFKFPKAEMSPV